MTDLAPVYDTSAGQGARARVSLLTLLICRAQILSGDGRQSHANAGAFFTSHKTNKTLFFEVVGTHRAEGEIKFWNLRCRQHDFLLTVFNT